MAAIPSDLDADNHPDIWWFAPHGYPIHSVLCHGYQNQTPSFDKDGDLADSESDQFPSMEPMEMGDGGELMVDEDNTEFLAAHCRRVQVYESFDQHDFDLTTDPAIEPWPDAIVEACMRAASLRGVVFELEQMRNCMPKGFEDDTIKAVLDNFLVAKLELQIAEVEEKIAAHRKAHPDVTVLEEPDDGN